MSIILDALKNRDLREERSNMQIIDDWGIGQMDSVVSEHDDSLSLGPMSFEVQTWTTLYLVIARRVKTTDCLNDIGRRKIIEDAAKSIHHDVYGELMNELGKVLYHMEYSGKKESMKQLSKLIDKWSM